MLVSICERTYIFFEQDAWRRAGDGVAPWAEMGRRAGRASVSREFAVASRWRLATFLGRGADIGGGGGGAKSF